MAKTFNLFISHSWSYGDAYDRLIKLLNADPYFSFRDFSVPKDDPVHNAPNSTALYEAIKRKIAPCHVVLIMAGKYATYSNWINKEIKISKNDFSKPIVAVNPWGAQQISITVREAADVEANWNTDSIVKAIRSVAL
jgi:hypothetical protein